MGLFNEQAKSFICSLTVLQQGYVSPLLLFLKASLQSPPPLPPPPRGMTQPAKQLRMVFVQRCRSAVLGIYQPPFQPAPCLSSARTFMVIAETAGAAAVLNHGREMALLALPRRAQTRQDPWHLLGLESQPCTHSTGMAPAAWAARSWFTPLTRPTAGARIRPAAGVNRPMEIRWSPARQQQLKRWHQKLFFMHKTSYFCMTFGFTAAPARRAGCLSLAKARMEDFLFFLFFFLPDACFKAAFRADK